MKPTPERVQTLSGVDQALPDEDETLLLAPASTRRAKTPQTAQRNFK